MRESWKLHGKSLGVVTALAAYLEEIETKIGGVSEDGWRPFPACKPESYTPVLVWLQYELGGWGYPAVGGWVGEGGNWYIHETRTTVDVPDGYEVVAWQKIDEYKAVRP